MSRRGSPGVVALSARLPTGLNSRMGSFSPTTAQLCGCLWAVSWGPAGPVGPSVMRRLCGRMTAWWHPFCKAVFTCPCCSSFFIPLLDSANFRVPP